MRLGVRMGVDFVLRQRSKSYVNRILFLEYINDIFVPYLNELQEMGGFEACEAVLLMDNCSNHMSDNVIAILTRKQVKIVIFASHMTYIFQILDVMLFGALKKYATGLETLNEESWRATFFLKVYRGFKEMMVEIDIWRAFAAIGFAHDIDQILYGLLFDKQKFRQSPDFVELWGAILH
jgi:hypothetical protein